MATGREQLDERGVRVPALFNNVITESAARKVEVASVKATLWFILLHLPWQIKQLLALFKMSEIFVI